MRIFLIAVFLLSPLNLLMAQKPDAVAVTCDFLEKVPGSDWQVVDSRSFLPPYSKALNLTLATGVSHVIDSKSTLYCFIPNLSYRILVPILT